MQNSENTQLIRAEKLMEIGRFNEAVPFLNKAYTQNPQNYQTVCSLSYCFSELEQNDKSVKYAEQAIVIEPNEEWAYRLKGVQLVRNGNYQDALKYAKKAVDCSPENELALGNYVFALIHNQKFAEAKRVSLTMLKLFPDSAQSHYISGHVNLKLYNLDEAERDLKKALKISPEYADALTNLAIVTLKKAGKEKNKNKEILENSALSHFHESLKLEPNNAYVLQNLRNQFEYSSTVFVSLFFSPLLALSFYVSPVITTILTIIIFIITFNSLLSTKRQKAKLSPEMRQLIKVKNYSYRIGQLAGSFVQGLRFFYNQIWQQTILAIGIFLLFFCHSIFPLHELIHFKLKILFWANNIWLLTRLVKYTGE